jgi:hypothetical protein
MPEQKQAQPLSGEEVQEAIMFKVKESLSRTCHLRFDNAYAYFKAEISIRLSLTDLARTGDVKDNHLVTTSEDTGIPGEPETHEATLVMEPQPPNVVRVETGQAVPIRTQIDGKTQTRRVKYTARQLNEAQAAVQPSNQVKV